VCADKHWGRILPKLRQFDSAMHILRAVAEPSTSAPALGAVPRFDNRNQERRMSSIVFDGPEPHRIGNDGVIAQPQRTSPCAAAVTLCTTLQENMWGRDKFIRALRWWSASAAVALALAGCGGGGEAVSPTSAAPAQVTALTLAQQSVNARMPTLPHPVALAAVSPGTATEAFENGMAEWSNWGNAQVVAGAGTSGSNAMQVGTGAGGAGLAVPGIVPGTAYRLTANVKVSDPSEAAFIGINMLDSSGNQVVGHSSPAVSSTGYVTVTVDLVAPANSAVAIVWIWKNAGSGNAYLDDVSFGPATNPPPTSAPPASNLVSNGGFESGMANWVNWGNASAVSGQANSGTSALSVGTAAGGAGQTVGGIVPGTVYRLVAHAKVSDSSETVFVGVNLLNQAGAAVAQMAVPVSSTTYTPVSFDITAPPDAVNAVVFVWMNAGSGFGYVDDIVFGAAPGSAPAPDAPPPWANLVVNGGFENGLTGWINWGNSAPSSAAAAGSSAAQVGPDAGGFGQVVGGIVAGATYTLSAQVKSPLELGYLGLKFMDNAGNVLAQNFVTFREIFYTAVQLELAAPANATTALVYVWKDAPTFATGGFATIDEVVMAQKITAALASPQQVSTSGATALQLVQLAGGGHAVVWTGSIASSPNPAVYAQLFDPSGQKQGAPITVFAGPLTNGPIRTTWFGSGGEAGLPDGSFLVAAYGRGGVFVQKVSATGQLLASGGVSDPGVNGGLAAKVADPIALGVACGPLFANPDRSYVLELQQILTGGFARGYLLNVDSGGNVVGAPADITGNDYFNTPAVARLTGGNFMVAGSTNNIPTTPGVIKIVTSTGQEVGRQTLIAASPGVAALANGTGLVKWFTSVLQPHYAAELIDESGNLVGTASTPQQNGMVTGLPHGGYVATWLSGSQVLAQYFTTSGQVAGGAFVVADNVSSVGGVSPTPDGFRAVYQATTSAGPQIFEIRFSAPALN
jgi:hypothetical protein